MDDDEIIHLLWARNQEAIVEIASAYGTKLYYLAKNILKNNEDAEECVNDTYLKAWHAIPPEKPDCLLAYLAKICRYTAFGMLDRKNAAKRKSEIVSLTEEMERCIPAPKEAYPMQDEEIGSLLNTFVTELPETSRLIFIRRYWFADSVRDIAIRYHISESKVKTTLFRTRNKLRKYLESEGIPL